MSRSTSRTETRSRLLAIVPPSGPSDVKVSSPREPPQKDLRRTRIAVLVAEPRPKTKRRQGLFLGAAGIALLFIPAAVLAAAPGVPSLYAILPMAAGIILLVAGFLALPGSLANVLRPKP